MQIERVETFPLLHQLERPYGDANGFKKYRTCYLLRITTRSGIQGWGEVIDWLPTLEKGMQERIIPYLIGKPATDRSKLVKVIKKWHQRAAAGVSMALTEIVAKKAGLSICDLWGGRLHQSIPAYASFQSYWQENDWQKRSLAMVEQQVSTGFQKIKVKIGGMRVQEDQQHITLLQKAFGDVGLQLALDANQSYDLAAVKQWERLFREWSNLMWLEEPLPMERIEEYSLLRSFISAPLAGGENLLGGSKFVPLLRAGALDIIQPDTMHVDGMEGFRETLQAARQFGLRVSPHAFDGALSRLYALFALACLPPWSKMKDEQIEPVEWDAMENPFTRLIPLAPLNGTISVPDGIGLGMEIDTELIEKFRWDGKTYT